MNKAIGLVNNIKCRVYNLNIERLIKEANTNFICYRDFETAMNQVSEALLLDPENVKGLMIKGNILISISKDLEALKYFDKAIELDSKNAEAYASKAAILEGFGEYNEALAYCQKAFEYLNYNDETLLPALCDQKIAILMKMRKYEDARKTLNKCREILSLEDSHYLASCYESNINSYCKKQQKERKKLAFKLVK